ncbi:hypothetical protein CASFOL_034211 [Castilleja foliolosa]|uniref:Uncharacterized protein n=1 Tax=Castilleja foliolosa TaxID=1961234 RepID=A0ABD3BZC4_9LAMI
MLQVADLGYWGPIEIGFCSDLGGVWIGGFPAATWVTSSRVGLCSGEWVSGRRAS